LFQYLRKMRPEFVINAGEDSAGPERKEAMQAQAVLPQAISRACLMVNTPWAHVVSGNNGTMALAEESISGAERAYILTMHSPFTEWVEASNWLSQLQRRDVSDGGGNSVSHVDDCARACLELWDRCAPFGSYNVVNAGEVTTNHVRQMIQRVLRPTARLSCL